MIRSNLILAVACLTLTFAGCCDNCPFFGKSESAQVTVVDEAAPPKLLALAANAGEPWGTIRGQVVYAGASIPPKVELKIDKDKDHCLSKGSLHADDWVVNPANRGVRWVMVGLKPEKGKKLDIHPSLQEVQPKEVILDQPCCAYEPRVLGVRIGQKLVAKNPSPVLHNVSVTGLINSANPSIPAGGSHTFDLKLERNAIKIACGIHPWMAGYVWTFDHPYYAVSDADGRFEIKLAPGGKQHLMVWHERVGWVAGGRDGMAIEVKPGEVTDLGKIELKPRD